MKLTKFSMQKMSVAEMNAIKAGSAECRSGGASCFSSSGDADNGSQDTDRD